jgi:hypothetical protein
VLRKEHDMPGADQSRSHQIDDEIAQQLATSYAEGGGEYVRQKTTERWEERKELKSQSRVEGILYAFLAMLGLWFAYVLAIGNGFLCEEPVLEWRDIQGGASVAELQRGAVKIDTLIELFASKGHVNCRKGQ